MLVTGFIYALSSLIFHLKNKMAILSSAWDGLNPYLLAYFYEVDKEGNQVGDTLVKAPLTESNLDMTLNWQSPFENSGAESMKPSMAAMAQSGEAVGIIDAAKPMVNKLANVFGANDQSNAIGDNLKSAVKSVEGRTGLTKLNSVQTFSSMPPIKLQVTALFRAWQNASSEVESPVDQLIKWALPVELSKNGIVANSLNAINSGVTAKNAMEAVLPSLAPVFIGLTYKTRTYAPLVIESIGLPISSPITKNGNYIEMSIPMTLCSLAAWDRADYLKTRG